MFTAMSFKNVIHNAVYFVIYVNHYVIHNVMHNIIRSRFQVSWNPISKSFPSF